VSFPKSVADKALVACGRYCCICHKFCGTKMQCHHIVPEGQQGDDTFGNCIPLCLDCHADVLSYNRDHPVGRKYSPAELRGHRDRWYQQVDSGQLQTGKPSDLREFATDFSDFLSRFKIDWRTEVDSGQFIDGKLKRIIGTALHGTADLAARVPEVIGASSEVHDLLRRALTSLRALETLPFPGTRIAQDQQVWKPGNEVIAQLERASSIIKGQLDAEKGDLPVAGSPGD